MELGRTVVATAATQPEPESTAAATAATQPEPESTAAATAATQPEPGSTAAATAATQPEPGSTAAATAATQPETVLEVKDNQALTIALSITLITIAGLIVLLGVLVYLLVGRTTAKKDDNKPDSDYSYLERSQQSATSLSDEYSGTITDEGAR